MLIALGLALFLAHTILYVVIQGKLRSKGLWNQRIETAFSAVKMYKTYLCHAEENHWAPSIAYIAPTLLVISVILLFAGAIVGGGLRR